MSKRRDESPSYPGPDESFVERFSDGMTSDKPPRESGITSRERLADESSVQPVTIRPASEPGLATPSSEQVLATVLDLQRRVGVELPEEAIARGYLDALEDLFPARRFAVRLFDTSSFRVFAREPLGDSGSTRGALSSSALERHDVPTSSALEAGVEVSSEYRPIFDPPGPGFDVPLTVGLQLIGALSVEYGPDDDEPPWDRSLVVSLALQLAAALRNARLLRESNVLRDQLEKLLEHANAPIVVIGREREVRVVNRAMLNLLGAPREQFLGRDMLSFLPEPEKARILPIFLRALRGAPSANFEIALRRGDGGTARLVFNTATVMSADGAIEAVIAIGRDLTEVRDLEAQVIQAEKLATLGQLAAGVVHELNNPLTSISVYADYLLRRGEQNGAEASDIDKLRRIVESSDRILRFTRDLVTYARPSSEPPRAVRLREALEQSLVFCEHVIEEARARVTRRYEAADATVYAVRSQLHQVFINLITNACQALGGEGGELTLALETDEGWVSVRVEDDGCGVSAAELDRIFEPFFSTKKEGEGTGLGLSIVRNIVEQHGGVISIESRVGEGTAFEVRLPSR